MSDRFADLKTKIAERVGRARRKNGAVEAALHYADGDDAELAVVFEALDIASRKTRHPCSADYEPPPVF